MLVVGSSATTPHEPSSSGAAAAARNRRIRPERRVRCSIMTVPAFRFLCRHAGRSNAVGSVGTAVPAGASHQAWHSGTGPNRGFALLRRD